MAHEKNSGEKGKNWSTQENRAGSVSEGVLVQSRDIGELHLHTRSGATSIPRQLPPSPRKFVGRVDELNRMTGYLDDSGGEGAMVIISAISGFGGIGKTWLTLYWAHRNIDKFPDGQIFIDLRGFSPSGQPLTPELAVRAAIDAFGIEPDKIPVDFNAQVGLYRSLVSRKKILIVLDNAKDSQQVVSLLPGSPSCTVFITSRDRLTSLVATQNVDWFKLDRLDDVEARALLVERLGRERIESEEDIVLDLLRFCAGSPLALSILASRASVYPDFPLSVWVDELRDASNRLKALDTGDPMANISVVLSWSYNALGDHEKETFRIFGLAPGEDVSTEAMVSLVGQERSYVCDSLLSLEKVSLVQQSQPGRWRMHDLIKLYAEGKSREFYSVDAADKSLLRMIDFYLHSSHSADRQINPRRPPIKVNPPFFGCKPVDFSDRSKASKWLKSERENILAAQRLSAQKGWHRRCWQLTWAIDSYQYRQGYLNERISYWKSALHAARGENNPDSLLMVHRLFGHAYTRVGEYRNAVKQLENALLIAQGNNDLFGQAQTNYTLTKAWEDQGDDRKALDHATEALRLFRILDDPTWIANTLNMVGWYSASLGYLIDASSKCQEALILCREIQEYQGEAQAIYSLGYIAEKNSDYAAAEDYYMKALELFREIGHGYYEVDILDRLGQTCILSGRREEAYRVLNEALSMYRNQSRVDDADRIIRKIEDEGGDGLDLS
jgi:tetratricopeptide (TPR) repeat protein